jgi:hypothetical protein
MKDDIVQAFLGLRPPLLLTIPYYLGSRGITEEGGGGEENNNRVFIFLSFIDNVRKFIIANKSEKPRIVYVYTNKGLIEGSPTRSSASFSFAHKALYNFNIFMD